MNALELAIKEFDDMIETRKNALARGHAKDYGGDFGSNRHERKTERPA